jgi:hypothetical protein
MPMTALPIRYFLRRNESKQGGPFTLDEILKIFRRVDHDGYTGDSLYRRSRVKEWKPLRAFAHFEFDDENLPRLDSFRRAGIEYVEWLNMGLPHECESCKKLNGTIFLIGAAPPMPPVDCRCELWCGCVYVAHEPHR